MMRDTSVNALTEVINFIETYKWICAEPKIVAHNHNGNASFLPTDL